MNAKYNLVRYQVYDPFRGYHLNEIEPCPRCFSKSFRFKYFAFYKTSNLPISYFFQTELQTVHWQEPLCDICCKEWITNHTNIIEQKILDAIVKIQRFWHKHYWSPPTATFRGGIIFRKCRETFVNQQKKMK